MAEDGGGFGGAGGILGKRLRAGLPVGALMVVGGCSQTEQARLVSMRHQGSRFGEAVITKVNKHEFIMQSARALLYESFTKQAGECARQQGTEGKLIHRWYVNVVWAQERARCSWTVALDRTPG